ncbi:MAG: hypothetical protein AAB446_02935 [Patescibacteria group bacterium]
MKKRKPPKDINRLFNLGLIKLEADFESLPKETIELFINKKYKKCLVYLNKVLDENPYNIGALLYKSIILKYREKYQESNNCLDLFINQFQYFSYAHQYQAENYLKLGKYEEAMEACKGCLFINKDNPYIWGLVSLSCFLRDKKSLAYAFLEEAEKYVKKDKGQLYLIRGFLEKTEGRKEDALISFMQSRELIKENDGFFASEIYNLLKNENI